MKAKTLSLQLLLVATIAGFAASATAAMYKWTDKQGNVHYTQEPPPEGNTTEIAPPPRVAAPAANKPNGKDTSGEVENGKTAEGEAPLTPEQQEIYSRNCEAARGNMETYKTARRVQQADGEIVVMDDEIRQKKMQQAEEQIKKFCK
jgi:hypothetical protein